jgi:hypothetical protein
MSLCFPSHPLSVIYLQALNLCNGGVTLGAIMVATVLLGYGEHHLSYKTKVHDLRAYAAAVFPDEESTGDAISISHSR